MAGKLLYARMVLDGEISEVPARVPFLGRHQTLFRDLLEAIESARRNARVRALLLVVRSPQVGWAQIEELRVAITALRGQGKQVLVYLESGGDNRTLYLAASADRIVVPPSASIDLVGLRSEGYYLREFLDSLGVAPQVISIGDYKSAGEFLSRSGMSDSHREMVESILDDYTGRIVEALAVHSGMSSGRVRELIDEGPFSAQRALREGLVDELAYEDELEERLKAGSPPLARLDAGKLMPRHGLIRRIFQWRRPRIAQIVVNGMISYGDAHHGPGPVHAAGSNEVIGQIRSARRARRVKAILLRVNSPGGSGLASDLIWRELSVANQSKPVIISLGDTAASGGYYVALAGRRIFASPSTLTGSIGVVGGKLSIRDLLDRLKVRVDGVEKGSRAGYTSPSRPFSEREEEVLREQMGDFYESLFLAKVAGSRGRSAEEVRPLAGGRVWTGSQSIRNGLVDEEGGLLAALDAARREAGLEEGHYRVVTYGRRRRLRDLIPFSLEIASSSERLFLLWIDGFRIR